MQNENKIDLFVATTRSYFPAKNLMTIHSQLEKSDIKTKFPIVLTLPYKNPLMMLLVSYVFGLWGVDRFILGQPVSGFLKLFTLGGFFIWYLIDVLSIMKITKKYNYRLFMRKF